MGMLSKGKKAEKQAAPDAQSAPDDGAVQPEADPSQAQGDVDNAAMVAPPESDQEEVGESPDDETAEEQQPAGGAQPGQDEEGGQDGEDTADASDAQSDSQGHIPLDKVPLSAALKEEYQRCNAALYTALYTNDKVAHAVLEGLVMQGPHKIESLVKASAVLFFQINKQLNFIKDTPQVVMPFAQDVISHVIDIAEQVKKMPITQQEAIAALGSLQELVLRTCGVSKKNLQVLQHTIPRSQIDQNMEHYKAALQFAHGGTAKDGDPNAGAQGAPPPEQAAAPASGPPPDAAAPPAAPVPAGGMLSQAAAAAPPAAAAPAAAPEGAQ